MNTRRMYSSFAFVTLFVACDPATPSLTDAGMIPDSQVPDTQLGGDAGAPDGSVLPLGHITIGSRSVSATFVSAGDNPCSARMLSTNCTHYDCPFPAPNTNEMHASAGTLSVAFAEMTTVVPSREVGEYEFVTQLPFAIGSTARVSGSGDIVPAFALERHILGRATLTAPALPQGAERLQISRSAPLRFSWNSATEGQIVIALSARPAQPGSTNYLTCAFDATAGTAEIPAEIVQSVRPEFNSNISINYESSTETRVQDWLIRLVSIGEMVTSDGRPAGASVQFVE